MDLDLFREDKGGSAEKIREIQRKRYKDLKLVDIVVEKDTLWRQMRHKADQLNKAKNVCSKAIGEKMKKKETEQGDGSEDLLQDIADKLEQLSLDSLRRLSVTSIKSVSFTCRCG